MHNILRCTIEYVFSMYTMLCYHYHCSVPEFSIPEKKPCPHQQSPPLPPPQPLTTRNPLCVCGSACSGCFPSVESHPVCPSVSASLTERRVSASRRHDVSHSVLRHVPQHGGTLLGVSVLRLGVWVASTLAVEARVVVNRHVQTVKLGKGLDAGRRWN